MIQETYWSNLEKTGLTVVQNACESIDSFSFKDCFLIVLSLFPLLPSLSANSQLYLSVLLQMNLKCCLKLELVWLIHRERRPKEKQERSSWKKPGKLMLSFTYWECFIDSVAFIMCKVRHRLKSDFLIVTCEKNFIFL